MKRTFFLYAHVRPIVYARDAILDIIYINIMSLYNAPPRNLTLLLDGILNMNKDECGIPNQVHRAIWFDYTREYILYSGRSLYR